MDLCAKSSVVGSSNGRSVLPPINRENALFLDLDGTLLEIAATPDGVRVSKALLETVRRLLAGFGGAVALVSGRTLRDIDRLFPVDGLPVAALHGLQHRDASGQVRTAPDGHELAGIRKAVEAFARRWPGLRVEDKGETVAVHYRQAPKAAAPVEAFLSERVRDRDDLQLLRGKMVIELKPKGANKGSAIVDFMGESPFYGRVPVFVGDDVTDEDGFAAVNRMGGCSIRVGDAADETTAQYRLADVAAVLDWLAAVAAAADSRERSA